MIDDRGRSYLFSLNYRQTVLIVFFSFPLQPERQWEDIPKHTLTSKCEPCYFCIFQEGHCSAKFQMKGWYKTFFPNISNGEFSCSDHFSFVEGHIKLYAHIKRRYVSLGEYIGITGPLIIFPWSLNICSWSLCYIFIVDIQMELKQEFSGQKKKKDKTDISQKELVSV